jgi:hypothetical protein
MFENRMLRRIYGTMRVEMTGGNYRMRSFINCAPHQT